MYLNSFEDLLQKSLLNCTIFTCVKFKKFLFPCLTFLEECNTKDSSNLLILMLIQTPSQCIFLASEICYSLFVGSNEAQTDLHTVCSLSCLCII